MKTNKRIPGGPFMLLASGALLTAFCLLQPPTVKAQWTTPDANQNIYNTNSGNVGIGTTTPNALLEVKKSQSAVTNIIVDNPFTTAGNSAYSAITLKQAGVNRLHIASVNDNHSFITPGTAQFWNFANAPTVFATNGSERLRITATGQVGVGTTVPTAQLQILAPDGLALRLQRNANSVNFGVGQFFVLDNSSGSQTDYAQISGIIASNTAGAENGVLAFFTRGAGSLAERMRITSSGNVGIGTSTPAYKLDVAGEIRSSTGGFRFPDGSIQTTAASGGGAVPSVFGRTGAVVAATNDYTWAQINKSVSSLADLQIRNAGDLNAGTVPIGRIGLSGNAGVSTFLRGDNTWGPVPSSQWTSSTNNISYNAGNVGIGTSTPDATLAVSSNIGDGFYAASISNANIYGYGMRINTAHGSSDTTRPTLSVENNGIPILQVLGAGPTSLFGNGDQYAAFIKNTGTYGFGLRITSGPSTNGRTALLVENASSTSLLQVQNNGNVGIGAVNPSYKLDVAGVISSSTGGFRFPDGTVQLTAASGGGGPVAWAQVDKSTSSLADITTRNAGDLNTGTVPIGRIGLSGNAGVSTFLRGDNTWGPVPSSQWTSGTNNISYSSGNVGIGTTAPSAGLDVQNSVTAVAAYGVRLQQALTAGTSNAELNGLFINTTFIDGLAVGVRHNALVTGAGNIGFGTSATGAGVDVQNVGVPTSGTTFGTRFQQTLPSAGNNSVSTAVYINPVFNDGLAVGVRHNGLVVAAGDVGIGTTTPGAKLEVVGNVNITGTGNITAAGTIEGGTIKAKYQDVAEWVDSSQDLSPGTVVVVDHTKSNQVIASSQAYDTRVAGVISERPGIALGEAGDNRVLVATTGRVRLTVDASRGPIQIGDLLVTSNIPGVAMKSQALTLGGVQIHRPGTLVGKALEPLAKGQGKILVLLSLQ